MEKNTVRKFVANDRREMEMALGLIVAEFARSDSDTLKCIAAAIGAFEHFKGTMTEKELITNIFFVGMTTGIEAMLDGKIDIKKIKIQKEDGTNENDI